MNIRVKMTQSQNANYHGVSSQKVVTLDLEAYLKGVVPSEVYAGSDPIETLRAQAVAARTYAMRKINERPSAEYDIEDTTDNQSYDVTTFHSRTNAAIDYTAGQILLVDGEVCDTMYSANNGGTTRSAYSYSSGKNDAGYLLQRSDPWNGSGKAEGHRVGMSQVGARAMGKAGKSYKEILGFYYARTRLTKSYGNGSYELLGSYLNQTGVTCQASGTLNVRSEPNGTKIRELSKGVTVTILEERSKAGFGWFRIKDSAGNTDGWVRWDYVSVTNSTSGGNSGGGAAPSDTELPADVVASSKRNGYIATEKDPLRIRSKPSGTVIGNAAKGAAVYFYKTSLSTEWYYVVVKATGLTGYGSATYIKPNESSGDMSYPIQATVETKKNGVGGYLNMRGTASQSGTLVCKVPNGSTIYVSTLSGTWLPAKYNGNEGYVMGKFIAEADAY